MKGLMVIFNSGKFHQDSICGSKVINYFHGDAVAMKWTFWGGGEFLGPWYMWYRTLNGNLMRYSLISWM